MKQVHPDAGTPSTKEFLELQSKFEEASRLLNAQATASRIQVEAVTFATASSSSHRTATAPPGHHHQASHSSVPVMGLSQARVYPFTAAILAMGATSYMMATRSKTPLTADEQKSSGSASRSSSSKANETQTKQVDLESQVDTRMKYRALESGPWNVIDAKASALSKVWAPSKSHDFADSKSFYANRTLGQTQKVRVDKKKGKVFGYEAIHEPQSRRGIDMLPVHTAAEDGHMWFLEQCAINSKCRDMLNAGDAEENTPLHHAAWAGRVDVAIALLRLGAETDARNAAGLIPHEVADAQGHQQVAALLLDAKEAADGKGCGPIPQHPDGLGTMSQPPDDVVFTGIRSSDSLRHAVNMSVGYMIAPPFPISQSLKESPNAAERTAAVVAGALQDTEFDLEDLQEDGKQQAITDLWSHSADKELDVEVCGLLVYESPGQVSADAPGHWFAIRRSNSGGPVYWRLDPLRGSFALSDSEYESLVKRYKIFRFVRGPPHLRVKRTEKLQSTNAEAEALLRTRDGVSG